MVAYVAIQDQLLELARELELSQRGAPFDSTRTVNIHFAKKLRQRAFEFRQRPERATSFFEDIRKSREAFEKLADVTEHMANASQRYSATRERHEPVKPIEPDEIKTFPLTNMKVIPR